MRKNIFYILMIVILILTVFILLIKRKDLNAGTDIVSARASTRRAPTNRNIRLH